MLLTLSCSCPGPALRAPSNSQGTVTARQLLLADVLLMLLGSVMYLAAGAWAAARRAAAAGAAAAACDVTPPASPSKPGSLPPWSPGDGRRPTGGSPWASPSLSPCKLPPEPGGGGGWRRLADGAGSLASLAAATALLSPLLGTLTETVSPDSIVACACLLKLAHLFLHDYHFAAGLAAALTGSLALGAAVCASVLLASRLGSPEAVYAQVGGAAGACVRGCIHVVVGGVQRLCLPGLWAWLIPPPRPPAAHPRPPTHPCGHHPPHAHPRSCCLAWSCTSWDRTAVARWPPPRGRRTPR